MFHQSSTCPNGISPDCRFDDPKRVSLYCRKCKRLAVLTQRVKLFTWGLGHLKNVYEYLFTHLKNKKYSL